MGLFLLSVLLLVLGYIIYGTIVKKIFDIRPNHQTPAITYMDGVDYMPLPPWRLRV